MTADSSAERITSLERQVHSDDRVSVFLDGEFAFGVHEDIVVKHGLQEGATLTAEERAEIERDEQYVQAKETAFDYLAHKPRSEEEVRRRLREDDVPPAVVDQVVARLEELDYLDDESYAQNYAQNRFSSKKYGPIRIRRELRKRGIDRHIADAAVEELRMEHDLWAAAWTHAKKRWPRLADEDDPRRRKQKMYRYLRRRGFSADTIYSVLDKLEDAGVGT